jgi:hypothetical protein
MAHQRLFTDLLDRNLVDGHRNLLDKSPVAKKLPGTNLANPKLESANLGTKH